MKGDPLTQDLIVLYLLGDLPETQQAAIEDRAFKDSQYLQEILAAESDLIDDYVRGELSESSRRQFESRFLASEQRRRKVEFAKALATVSSEMAVESDRQVVVAKHRFRDALAAFLRELSPIARLSFAAAAVLLLIGGVWSVVETARLRAQIAQLESERQSREHDQQALEKQIADERARSADLAAG